MEDASLEDFLDGGEDDDHDKEAARPSTSADEHLSAGPAEPSGAAGKNAGEAAETADEARKTADEARKTANEARKTANEARKNAQETGEAATEGVDPRVEAARDAATLDDSPASDGSDVANDGGAPATSSQAGKEEPAPGAAPDGTPPRGTYEFTPSGASCAACGDVVDRRWQEEAGLVCLACKSW